MTNTNCLKGMRCPNPECKSYGPFKISATSFVTVHDDGTDEPGDFDWDSESYCKCIKCDEFGRVSDFNFDNQDDEAGP
jgi:hypothetical protein